MTISNKQKIQIPTTIVEFGFSFFERLRNWNLLFGISLTYFCTVIFVAIPSPPDVLMITR